MNILMLYHRLPFPPNKGEKMRAYQQVRYLAARHRVWLACFVDTPEDRAHCAEVSRWCTGFEAVALRRGAALSRGGLDLVRGGTLTEGYYGNRAMKQVIDRFASETQFDVAFAFSSSMGAYLERVPARRRVLDMNDFDSHKWADYAAKSGWPLSELFAVEARRLRLREEQMLQQFDLTLMVNARECSRARTTGRVQPLHTPIDVSSYDGVQRLPSDAVVGFVGTMNYRPNIEALEWFGDAVWPGVRARCPDAQWWIIGRNPGRAVRRRHGHQGVVVTGGVPEIRDYLSQLRVFVAPARTEIGVQTKVLEALAAGRPTVITAAGHRGVAAQSGWDYLVADDAAAFEDAVVSLLGDMGRCRQLARSARHFARQHFDIDVIMPTFESLVCGAGAGEVAT